jgi:hypothetical protein
VEAVPRIGPLAKEAAPQVSGRCGGESSDDDLIHALAECRDAFEVPAYGSPLEEDWIRAINDPINVPAFVRAAINLQHDRSGEGCSRKAMCGVRSPDAAPNPERLSDQQVRKLMQVAHKWAGPDENDSRSDILEMALREIRIEERERRGFPVFRRPEGVSSPERCRLLDELIASWREVGNSPAQCERRIQARAALESAWPTLGGL